jgi:hypothetical protein
VEAGLSVVPESMNGRLTRSEHCARCPRAALPLLPYHSSCLDPYL